MKKVYVVNQAGHDVSSAVRYGELVYLTEDRVNIWSTDRLYSEFLEKLKCSDPEDYLLLSGPGILCVLASLIFYKLHGRVHTLVYNFNTRDYVVRDINIKGGDKDGNDTAVNTGKDQAADPVEAGKEKV